MGRSYAFEIAFCEEIYQRDRNDTSIVEMLANLYTKAGRIDDGLRLDRRHVRLQPNNPTAHYNLACSLALKKKSGEAIEAIRTALELGFQDVGWMLKDPDLAGLRRTPAFRRLLREFTILPE